MEVNTAIKIRRSIREYQDKPISKEILEQLIDAARFAPTARNIQPWEFVIITKEETLKKLAELADNGRFIAQAKACIAIFCQDTKYYLEDGCAATQNILLMAVSLGLGSCWVAGDKKPYCLAVANLLGVPAELKLVSLIALGYPAPNHGFKIAPKRDLKELIHWEKF
ncbi:MAG: nitroreductase family protein [Candidatus Omnitrophica bacterium]|nr:nitroreductase family protein [Candidatus Omnitrophota bacterium]